MERVVHMARIAPLFTGMTDTLILSCLQGWMGDAWADDGATPRCAQIVLGDFAFLAGDAEAPGALELAGHLPAGHEYLLAVPASEAWCARLEEANPGRQRRIVRYGLKKDPDVFDRERLTRFAGALPQGFRLSPIDERLYKIAMAGWNRDLCANFGSYADYHDRGLGVAALREADGMPVCGASSYSRYEGGIEIEIGTDEAYRRRGLARACAAQLILNCLDRGLYPSWDAANLASLALAQQLGYEPAGEYPTYWLAREAFA